LAASMNLRVLPPTDVWADLQMLPIAPQGRWRVRRWQC
jgi:hypothetical protein